MLHQNESLNASIQSLEKLSKGQLIQKLDLLKEEEQQLLNNIEVDDPSRLQEINHEQDVLRLYLKTDAWTIVEIKQQLLELKEKENILEEKLEKSEIQKDQRFFEQQLERINQQENILLDRLRALNQGYRLSRSRESQYQKQSNYVTTTQTITQNNFNNNNYHQIIKESNLYNNNSRYSNIKISEIENNKFKNDYTKTQNIQTKNSIILQNNLQKDFIKQPTKSYTRQITKEEFFRLKAEEEKRKGSLTPQRKQFQSIQHIDTSSYQNQYQKTINQETVKNVYSSDKHITTHYHQYQPQKNNDFIPFKGQKIISEEEYLRLTNQKSNSYYKNSSQLVSGKFSTYDSQIQSKLIEKQSNNENQTKYPVYQPASPNLYKSSQLFNKMPQEIRNSNYYTSTYTSGIINNNTITEEEFLRRKRENPNIQIRRSVSRNRYVNDHNNISQYQKSQNLKIHDSQYKKLYSDLNNSNKKSQKDSKKNSEIKSNNSSSEEEKYSMDNIKNNHQNYINKYQIQTTQNEKKHKDYQLDFQSSSNKSNNLGLNQYYFDKKNNLQLHDELSEKSQQSKIRNIQLNKDKIEKNFNQIFDKMNSKQKQIYFEQIQNLSENSILKYQQYVVEQEIENSGSYFDDEDDQNDNSYKEDSKIEQFLKQERKSLQEEQSKIRKKHKKYLANQKALMEEQKKFLDHKYKLMEQQKKIQQEKMKLEDQNNKMNQEYQNDLMYQEQHRQMEITRLIENEKRRQQIFLQDCDKWDNQQKDKWKENNSKILKLVENQVQESKRQNELIQQILQQQRQQENQQKENQRQKDLALQILQEIQYQKYRDQNETQKEKEERIKENQRQLEILQQIIEEREKQQKRLFKMNEFELQQNAQKNQEILENIKQQVSELQQHKKKVDRQYEDQQDQIKDDRQKFLEEFTKNFKEENQKQYENLYKKIENMQKSMIQNNEQEREQILQQLAQQEKDRQQRYFKKMQSLNNKEQKLIREENERQRQLIELALSQREQQNKKQNNSNNLQKEQNFLQIIQNFKPQTEYQQELVNQYRQSKQNEKKYQQDIGKIMNQNTNKNEYQISSQNMITFQQNQNNKESKKQIEIEKQKEQQYKQQKQSLEGKRRELEQFQNKLDQEYLKLLEEKKKLQNEKDDLNKMKQQNQEEIERIQKTRQQKQNIQKTQNQANQKIQIDTNYQTDSNTTFEDLTQQLQLQQQKLDYLIQQNIDTNEQQKIIDDLTMQLKNQRRDTNFSFKKNQQLQESFEKQRKIEVLQNELQYLKQELQEMNPQSDQFQKQYSIIQRIEQQIQQEQQNQTLSDDQIPEIIVESKDQISQKYIQTIQYPEENNELITQIKNLDESIYDLQNQIQNLNKTDDNYRDLLELILLKIQERNTIAIQFNEDQRIAQRRVPITSVDLDSQNKDDQINQLRNEIQKLNETQQGLKKSLQRNFRDEFTQLKLEEISREIDYKNELINEQFKNQLLTINQDGSDDIQNLRKKLLDLENQVQCQKRNFFLNPKDFSQDIFDIKEKIRNLSKEQNQNVQDQRDYFVSKIHLENFKRDANLHSEEQQKLLKDIQDCKNQLQEMIDIKTQQNDKQIRQNIDKDILEIKKSLNEKINKINIMIEEQFTQNKKQENLERDIQDLDNKLFHIKQEIQSQKFDNEQLQDKYQQLIKLIELRNQLAYKYNQDQQDIFKRYQLLRNNEYIKIENKDHDDKLEQTQNQIEKLQQEIAKLNRTTFMSDEQLKQIKQQLQEKQSELQYKTEQINNLVERQIYKDSENQQYLQTIQVLKDDINDLKYHLNGVSNNQQQQNQLNNDLYNRYQQLNQYLQQQNQRHPYEDQRLYYMMPDNNQYSQNQELQRLQQQIFQMQNHIANLQFQLQNCNNTNQRNDINRQIQDITRQTNQNIQHYNDISLGEFQQMFQNNNQQNPQQNINQDQQQTNQQNYQFSQGYDNQDLQSVQREIVLVNERIKSLQQSLNVLDPLSEAYRNSASQLRSLIPLINQLNNNLQQLQNQKRKNTQQSRNYNNQYSFDPSQLQTNLSSTTNQKNTQKQNTQQIDSKQLNENYQDIEKLNQEIFMLYDDLRLVEQHDQNPQQIQNEIQNVYSILQNKINNYNQQNPQNKMNVNKNIQDIFQYVQNKNQHKTQVEKTQIENQQIYPQYNNEDKFYQNVQQDTQSREGLLQIIQTLQNNIQDIQQELNQQQLNKEGYNAFTQQIEFLKNELNRHEKLLEQFDNNNLQNNQDNLNIQNSQKQNQNNTYTKLNQSQDFIDYQNQQQTIQNLQMDIKNLQQRQQVFQNNNQEYQNLQQQISNLHNKLQKLEQNQKHQYQDLQKQNITENSQQNQNNQFRQQNNITEESNIIENIYEVYTEIRTTKNILNNHQQNTEKYQKCIKKIENYIEELNYLINIYNQNQQNTQFKELHNINLEDIINQQQQFNTQLIDIEYLQYKIDQMVNSLSQLDPNSEEYLELIQQIEDQIRELEYLINQYNNQSSQQIKIQEFLFYKKYKNLKSANNLLLEIKNRKMQLTEIKSNLEKLNKDSEQYIDTAQQGNEIIAEINTLIRRYNQLVENSQQFQTQQIHNEKFKIDQQNNNQSSGQYINKQIKNDYQQRDNSNNITTSRGASLKRGRDYIEHISQNQKGEKTSIRKRVVSTYKIDRDGNKIFTGETDQELLNRHYGNDSRYSKFYIDSIQQVSKESIRKKFELSKSPSFLRKVGKIEVIEENGRFYIQAGNQNLEVHIVNPQELKNMKMDDKLIKFQNVNTSQRNSVIREMEELQSQNSYYYNEQSEVYNNNKQSIQNSVYEKLSQTNNLNRVKKSRGSKIRINLTEL